MVNYNQMEEYFKFINKHLDEGWKLTTTNCDEENCKVRDSNLGNTVGKPGKEEDHLHQVQSRERRRV